MGAAFQRAVAASDNGVGHACSLDLLPVCVADRTLPPGNVDAVISRVSAVLSRSLRLAEPCNAAAHGCNIAVCLDIVCIVDPVCVGVRVHQEFFHLIQIDLFLGDESILIDLVIPVERRVIQSPADVRIVLHVADVFPCESFQCRAFRGGNVAIR